MPVAINVSDAIERQTRNSVRILVMCSCFLVMFCDGYDLNLLGYVGPALMLELQIDKAQFGSVISAALVGYMVGAFLFSNMGDQLGRKPLILAGTVLFGALTLASAAASSMQTLILFRFLAGIGLGGAIPNAVALNTEFAPERVRAFGIGIMFVGYTLGGAAPGFVAAWFLSQLGWQAVVCVGGIVPLALAVILYFVLPESVKFLATRPRRHKELISTLSKLSRQSPPIPRDARIVLDEDVKSGLPVANLFTNGRTATTLLLWIAFVAGLTALLFIISWTPTLLSTAGIPARRAAFIGAMFQIGAAFGSVCVTRLVDRIGIKAVVLWLALSVPCIAIIGQITHSESVLVAAVFIAGFFASGGQVGLNSVAGTFYPTFVRATGVGWANGIGRLGSIIGPIIGGFLIATNMSVASLFICAALPFAIGTAAVGILWLHTREQSHLRASAEDH